MLIVSQGLMSSEFRVQKLMWCQKLLFNHRMSEASFMKLTLAEIQLSGKHPPQLIICK